MFKMNKSRNQKEMKNNPSSTLLNFRCTLSSFISNTVQNTVTFILYN